MNLNMEIGKKQDIYPSKKSINLCYQEQVSTKISTMALGILFVVVVVFALLKVAVFDLLVEKSNALADLERIERNLEYQLAGIESYDEVEEEYFRYSYKILLDEMDIQDRLEIIAMLEDTVFKNGSMSNVAITNNLVTLSFKGLNLNECAQLIADIQAYEMVESVLISNQTGSSNGTYEGNLTITLKAKNAGGEQ